MSRSTRSLRPPAFAALLSNAARVPYMRLQTALQALQVEGRSHRQAQRSNAPTTAGIRRIHMCMYMYMYGTAPSHASDHRSRREPMREPGPSTSHDLVAIESYLILGFLHVLRDVRPCAMCLRACASHVPCVRRRPERGCARLLAGSSVKRAAARADPRPIWLTACVAACITYMALPLPAIG